MGAPYPGFIGGAYLSRSINFANQRCVNLYPVANEGGVAKADQYGYLQGTPGLSLKLNISNNSGSIRALYKTASDVVIAVCGDGVYTISSSYLATKIGTLNTSSGVVSIAFNGVQVMLVDGAYGYIYTIATGVFAQITDPDMPKSSHVIFIDGYFLMNQVDTGRFWITSLYDGSSIDGLDFASAEGSPDNIVGICALRRQMWAFGTHSVQVFYDSGNVDFPFDSINGVFMEIGCIAKHSIANVDNTVFWLGSNKDGAGVVYMANGYQPQRISTNAIEFAIQGYADLTSAVAYVYQQEGATFYCLNFAATTWVYDLATHLWHERAYFSNGAYSRSLAQNHIYFNGSHLVGDYSSGNIYKLDLDTYTDNGQPIRRMRTAPHVTSGLNYIYYSGFQLDCQFGVGTQTGQGLNPQIVMRQSNDGGYTWSGERNQTLGATGAYKERAIWSKCGRSRDRVFEIVITDPVNVVLLNAQLDYTVGRV